MAKQLSLRPQDVVVAVKLSILGDVRYTIAQLAGQLYLSASEVHASLGRVRQARLVLNGDEGFEVVRGSLVEFLVSGVRYAFPAVVGAVTSGIPTAHSCSPLRELLSPSEELPPVWPHALGKSRGVSVTPFYATAPEAALRDNALYECLALIDGIRIGSSRERGLAVNLLKERLG